MSKKLETFTTTLLNLTASHRFFYSVLVLLALQGVWVAFSAVYPLPFDEYVHVGVIQIYADQWSPFISEQPASASIYGDITREASFLYYYLMSFPYRVIELFLGSDMARIIALRLLNVLFVIGGLALFRKLLLEWGLSKRVAHVALLAFVMTPIVPFLAAHVNYDNLMFLLTPVFLLIATRLIRGNQDLVRQLLLFVLVGSATVLIKRTFLPLAALAALYVGAVLLRRNGTRILSVLAASWRGTKKGASFLVLCVGLAMSLGLFIERYGGNVVEYGSIWPPCSKVQPREVCADWGPWYRDNVAIEWTRPEEPPYGNPVSFTQHWITWIMRGYYVPFSHTADAEPRPGDPFGGIEGKPLLPLPVSMGYLALVTGSAALLWQRKRIWQNPYLRFGLFVAVGFLVMQWLFNYQTYLRLWRPVAAQARYGLPILIILFAAMIQAASWSVSDLRQSKTRRKYLKAGLLIVFLALYVWGGGIAGWIIRAPDSWLWQEPTVQAVNDAAQQVLRYLVIH